MLKILSCLCALTALTQAQLAQECNAASPVVGDANAQPDLANPLKIREQMTPWMKIKAINACKSESTNRILTIRFDLHEPSTGKELLLDFLGPHPQDISTSMQCNTLAVADNQVVTQMNVWHTANQVESISFVLTGGTSGSFGAKSRNAVLKNYQFTANQELVGVYGAESGSAILNLGVVIYRATDCRVGEPPEPEAEVIAEPAEETTDQLEDGPSDAETTGGQAGQTAGSQTDARITQGQDQPVEEEGGSNLWVILVIGLVVAILIIVAVFVAVKKLRSIAEEDEQDEETPKTTAPAAAPVPQSTKSVQLASRPREPEPDRRQEVDEPPEMIVEPVERAKAEAPVQVEEVQVQYPSVPTIESDEDGPAKGGVNSSKKVKNRGH